MPNILREEDLDPKIDEILDDEDFTKSETQGETFESIEYLNITGI